ncbi:tripartite tricarboxylate transporter substrate binding protein [Bordetella sp. BOR01]|uniref:Bug family tripartite tricarboxylate transporter substrate binding protein n=1 Tax=Bordetella sp. BOR01 TaxID=2854779 RepID=UPI001C473A7C|nr:tripartite tricarboxylate transporter substrate binding protein [Bordetella sp. BOR01]MBV7485338.1 tripartite tricarboxylate transporter substrate binding protein [Bordetella sp. BOR01]
MKIARRLQTLLLAGSLALIAAPQAQAQVGNFPSKPITIVVPFGAGTTTDLAARFIGKHITDATKQPVIVDNKPGANGTIALQHVLRQPADGYTIVVGTNTTHAANLSLFKKLPYDPVADFVPITAMIVGGVVLTVAPGAPYNNVQELIAVAKKHPGKLTFGAGNSSSRAGGEVLKELAGIDILHVPYKTLTLAVTDLMGGQIDMVFGDAPAVMPHVRAGKLKALGVSTPTRMPGYEDIPTIAEQGVPGYEASGWLAVFAPKGIPDDVADQLNALIVPIMKSPEAAKYFGDNAWKPIAGTRQELAQFQKSEIARWAQLTKAAGIEPQ